MLLGFGVSGLYHMKHEDAPMYAIICYKKNLSNDKLKTMMFQRVYIFFPGYYCWLWPMAHVSLCLVYFYAYFVPLCSVPSTISYEKKRKNENSHPSFVCLTEDI